MTIILHDFHRMIGLWFDGVSICLKDELGIQLGADLLGSRYVIETIYYIDLKTNFMHRP